jgi:hypothetical protein
MFEREALPGRPESVEFHIAWHWRPVEQHEKPQARRSAAQRSARRM